MIRSIARWGGELGWRGQKAWEKEFSRLQYQALRKATGAVQGTASDKVNQMAGMEDVPTHLDNNQVRFVARQVEDPSKLGNIMPVGFGDERMLDDELAEEGDGRRWDDHGPQWVNREGKKDGFVSTLTRMASILPEGKPLWGGSCRKVEVEEVDLCPVNDLKGPEEWEKEIGKEGIGGAYIFSDGSLLESGNVGGGAFIVGSRGAEVEVECGIGNVATVWDGEVAGMAEGLAKVRQGGERKVLILVDSKAAIAAIKKAGRTGRARSRHLQEAINTIAEIREGGGKSNWGG